MKAFQDYYPEHLAYCYGCGRLNEHGYRIMTFWEGDEAVTRFSPQAFHTAVPGFVYGGLLASLIDCHSTGAAAAAMYRSEKRGMESLPSFRFVTGSLQVSYLKATPLGPELVIRGRVQSIEGRKVIIDSTLLVERVVTVRAEVVAIQMPDNFGA